MAHANIYIRKENEERWESITDKSAWVNAYLTKSPPNSIVEEQQLEPAPKVINQPAADAVVVQEGYTEEDYEGLIYDPIMNGVWDVALNDYVESDSHMIKELKRRGQVR